MYRQTTSSVLHDGEEVFRKTSADLQQDRLKELESNGIKSKLKGSKRPFELKIFLTKCDPDTASTNLEKNLLKFPKPRKSSC